MSVYRQPSSKIFQVDFWFRGTRYCRSSGTTNVVAAKRLEKQWKAQLRDAAGPLAFVRQHDRATFGAIADEYFDLIGAGTVNAVSLKATLVLAGTIVGRDTFLDDLDDLRMLRIRQVYENAPIGKTKEAGKRQPSSVNDFLRLVNRVRNFAIEMKRIAMVPLRPEAWVLGEKWRTREMSIDEEQRLLRASCPEVARVWQFGIETGLRRAALCGLKWSQIGDGQINVVEKGSEPHTVPLSSRALKILEEAKGHHPEYVFTKISKVKRDFVNPGDRIPYKAASFASDFKKVLKKSNIADFCVHDLRHTAATRLLRVCSNVVIVQKFLGHTTLKQTSRYVHMVQEDVAAAIARLDLVRDNAALSRQFDAAKEQVDATLALIRSALNLRPQLVRLIQETLRQAA